MESAAGFVLAGGQSSRMGSDKALVNFRGRPLIQTALEGIRAAGMQVRMQAGMEARIAGSRSSLRDYGVEIADTWVDVGPLGGVHAGISAALAEWNLFLPVDMPLMPASLLGCLLGRALLTRAHVTASRVNGRLEPYPVVLHRAVLPLIESRLRSGLTAGYAAWLSLPGELGSQLDSPAVEDLVQCGRVRHPETLPPYLWFRSANTPGELQRLERLSRGGALFRTGGYSPTAPQAGSSSLGG